MKKTAFSLLLSVIFYSSPGQTRIDQAVSVQSVTIANESARNLSKFEIDLFCCSADLKSAENLIWLSVKSDSKVSLTDGNYKYTTKGINDRKAYEFSGSVKTGNGNVKITDGYFDIKVKGKETIIVYNLILENGRNVAGEYSGKYKAEDWRIK